MLSYLTWRYGRVLGVSYLAWKYGMIIGVKVSGMHKYGSILGILVPSDLAVQILDYWCILLVIEQY